MNLYVTANFKKQYKKLPPPIKESTRKQLELLLGAPILPTVNLKKMNDPRDLWEGRHELQIYRFTLQIKEGRCILRNIGLTAS